MHKKFAAIFFLPKTMSVFMYLLYLSNVCIIRYFENASAPTTYLHILLVLDPKKSLGLLMLQKNICEDTTDSPHFVHFLFLMKIRTK